jgi:hypothetical protein
MAHHGSGGVAGAASFIDFGYQPERFSVCFVPQALKDETPCRLRVMGCQ